MTLSSSSTKQFDILIVGQGIAGTLLAWFLIQKGSSVLVMDNHHAGASSLAAAGLINPVTGKRFVKTWNLETLLPFAVNTYHQLEQMLQIPIFQERHLLRILKNADELNTWLARSGETSYRPYFENEADLENWSSLLHPFFGVGELRQAGSVDLPRLITAFKKFLKERGQILVELFDFEGLEIASNVVSYQEYKARSIIFCEGARMAQNPFFNYLPIQASKGEALVVKIPGFVADKILKKDIVILPLKNDLYWVGSTNSWAVETDKPSASAKQELELKIAAIINCPFEVVEHRAAIRPTVRDRRPFLGRHPLYPNLGIFNGLGTKGALLAPFFANEMAEHLLNGATIDPEVDIQRFDNQRSKFS